MNNLYAKDLDEAPLALSIDQFCRRHNICRASLYNLWTAGEGPAVIRVGSRRLISVEAAERWRREREAASAQPDETVPRAG